MIDFSNEIFLVPEEVITVIEDSAEGGSSQPEEDGASLPWKKTGSNGEGPQEH